MAITATTLSAAVGLTDTTVLLASITGVTTPSFQTGSGITYLFIDQELLLVMNAPAAATSPVLVKRGMGGTIQATHVSGSQVQVGLPSDFTPFVEAIGPSLTTRQTEGSLNWPATFLSGSTDAIPAGVAGFYVVKTAGVNAMTLAAPTVAQEGNIITVQSDTTNAHTITATSLFANGQALKTTATFPAFRGAVIQLRVCNLVYHVLSTGDSAGKVVLS
jgi:hypothetical protein